MLPLPGAPSSSWAQFRQRFRALFSGADPRVCVAFWLFGESIQAEAIPQIEMPQR
jgi:battenin